MSQPVTPTSVRDPHQHHDRDLPPTPPYEPSSDLTKMSTRSTETTSLSRWSSAEPKYIWVITGPAGCGKTSVAQDIHQTFSLPYLEGDAYHPATNVHKMETGIPLTDADRWDWLIQLRDEALSTLQQQQQQQQQQQHAEGPAPPPAGVVVTCSALKRKYRDVLRVAAYHHPDVRVRFVFLRVDEAALVERVRARRDHYMKDFMVRSQLETLEVPGGEERDVWTVDASGTGEVVRALAREVVRREMGV